MPKRFIVLALCATTTTSSTLLPDGALLAEYGPPQPLPRGLRAPLNASQTLREAAAARGVFIGSAINLGCLQNVSEPEYPAIIAREFDLTTAENECKWGSTEQTRGVFSLDACRTLENFTLSNTGSFRNHNLNWGSYNPDWLQKGNLPAADLKAALITHINAMAAAFGETSFAFDVVNEAVSDRANETLKPSVWYPALPDFVEIAFTAAHAAAPNAKLFYNDYAGEGLGPKSDKIYNFIKGLISQGIPVQGVGLQMHVSVDAYPAFSDVRVRATAAVLRNERH